MNGDAPTLPGYDYVRRLGRGGFSDVHLYEQHMPRRQVAIKVLRVDTLDERQRRAFTSEANMMAQLAEHPNIVSVISAALTSDGRPYLVMSYYPGDDLGIRVANRTFSVPEALRTGIQLACAVESAHRMGVVHRDIKPANILVSRSGAPGLTDFGIAGHSQALHEDDEIGVSIPWSAPEVLAGHSSGSVATDIYSLGATIWHLLVGRAPFKIPGGDNSQRATIDRVLRTRAPATGLPDVPTALERLLAQCLAKDPSHRPRSALQLARELQSIEVQSALSRTELVVLDPEVPDAPGHALPPPPGDLVVDPTVGKAPTALSPTPGRRETTGPGDVTLARHGSIRDERTGAAPTLNRRAPDIGADQRDVLSRPSGRAPWPAIAAVVAVLVAGGFAFTLVSNDDAADARPTATNSTTSQPPSDLVADVSLDPPAVSSRSIRSGDVRVSWKSVPGAAAYTWRRSDAELGSGEHDLGSERHFDVADPGSDRTCFVVTAYSTSGSPAESDRYCIGGSPG